jgi:UDP-N-acetylmuramyl pentapeptide phosphotransferase/UDP-N-acetylglucosamine-1-phosphate transferase
MYYVLLILASFGLSYVITYIFRKVAIRKKIIDIPNERSSHQIPTPRGGGVAIVTAWFAGITFLFMTKEIDTNLFLALLTGLILVFLGIMDDIIQLNPVVRFIGQMVATAIALFMLGGLKTLDLGFFHIEQNIVLSIIAFFGIIWFINLYNFLDGIDGYASMQAIFISLVFFFFTFNNQYLILTGATLGFIVWNWQPAKIFMGDVGSTLLGFNFGIMAIYEQNQNSISIIQFLIISSVFWFDATVTLIRRYRNKEKLSEAHKKHAYQRIVQAGYSHQKTVIFAIGINLLLFCLSIFASIFEKLSITPLIITVIFLFLLMKGIDKKKAFD